MVQIMRKFKSGYIKGFFMLLSGSIIAQIITFSFAPIITRLFSPEQMGVLTLILSVVNMFGTVICARYDMMIISTDKEDDVYKLIILSFFATIVLSAIISLIFFIYTNYNMELKKVLGVGSIMLFPILIIIGITNILTAYNNRLKEYGLISRVNIIRVTVQGTLQVIFGLMHYGTLSLLTSYLISITMGIRSQSKKLNKHLVEFSNISLNNIVKTMIKYKNQPIYSVPAIFLNSVSYSIIPFMINSLYGTKEVGYFSISFRLLGVPLALISTNASRIYFQKASEEYNKNYNFRKTFKSTTLILLLIAFPMTLFLIIFGQYIIVNIFGQNWIGAVVFIRILSPMYGLRLIVSALSVTLIIIGKQKYDMFLQATFLLATIISFILAKYFYLNLSNFILLISILYSINYLIYWLISYKFSKSKSELIMSN